MRTIEVQGQCRCGRVRFTLREEPIAFYLCHCTQCQAESGSAFGQSMQVRREAIDSVEGPAGEHVVEGPSGQQSRVTYCTNCLTFLWGGSDDVPQVLGLNAGSLEDTASLQPYGNMWTRSARRWASFADGPRYEKHPDEPLAMIHAWLRRPGAAG